MTHTHHTIRSSAVMGVGIKKSVSRDVMFTVSNSTPKNCRHIAHAQTSSAILSSHSIANIVLYGCKFSMRYDVYPKNAISSDTEVLDFKLENYPKRWIISINTSVFS